MSDLPDRITARVDYDGDWDGQWCEQGKEPIGIHAYWFDTYVRADLCDAVENEWRKDCEALASERDTLRARAEAAEAEVERSRPALMELLAFRAQVAHGSVNLASLAKVMDRAEQALGDKPDE